MTGTQSARAELPGLTPREELVLEERMTLSVIRPHHQPQPQEMSVDPFSSRRCPREVGMCLDCAHERVAAGPDLAAFEVSAEIWTRL